MNILFDDNLEVVDLESVLQPMADFMRSDYLGSTVSPPRIRTSLGQDVLVHTIGGDARSFGFRSYSVRPGLKREREDQIVVCWDRQTHDLKGIAIGHMLGAWRTGILGALSRAALIRQTGLTCGIVGTGLQALTQAVSTACIDPPARFLVYSRSEHERGLFARDLQTQTGVPTCARPTARHLVQEADVLIIATSSPTPVFEMCWLKTCRHITTVGPKQKSNHEVPLQICEWSDVIASDSPQQIKAQGQDHFLSDAISSDRIMHTGSLIDAGQQDPDQKTLYLSAGLAGSEVCLLDALLEPSDR